MIANSPRYQSKHNYEIGLRVENALIRAFPERFRRISVVAFYGIVELSGTVGSPSDKSLAVQIAERIPGVTTVVESVLIRNNEREQRELERSRPTLRRFHQRFDESSKDRPDWVGP
jgi:acyl-CoA synthetase (AMP-forming)/AMP-acid ligase II